MKQSPDQVWKNVLSHLQMEMPKVSFDTWVRDTVLVAYTEPTSAFSKASFVIGVRNSYARDWLENRITDLAARIVSEIVAEEVEVMFVVDDLEPASNDTTKFDLETTDVQVNHKIQYDEIVCPERVVAVPGYFHRLIPEIGARNSWLYIGWRQSVWDGQQNHHDAKTRRIAVREIIRYSGLSRRTFFRAVEDPSTWQSLAGLVERGNNPPQWTQGKDHHAHRLPNQYTVQMTLPLCTRDAIHLRNWFVSQIQAGNSLSTALAIANQTQDIVGVLIPTDFSSLSDSSLSHGLTVMDIVRELTTEDTLTPDLQKASEDLHRKIISAFGLILITHYFLETVIPKAGLTPAQAWLVTLARDHCYVNQETGEVRDEMIVHSGYSELAAWLGLNRSKTIWEWIRNESGPVNAFLSVLPSKENDNPNTLRLGVRLDEPIFDGESGTNSVAQLAQLKGATDTINHGADGTHRMAEMAPLPGASGTNPWREWHSLKLLNPTANTTNQNPFITQVVPEGQCPEYADQKISDTWDLDVLLRQNKVHPRITRELLIKKVSVQAFVSWLLFSFSQAGSRIRNPLAFTLSTLQKNPTLGAGSEFDRFADLPPTKLIRLLDWSMKKAADKFGYQESCPDPKWVSCMGISETISILKVILLGQSGDK